MSATKFDKDKPRISLIPQTALEQEARVLMFGAIKYGLHNWRSGTEWTRFIDASLRHIYAFANGENIDPETGINHLAHARCSLAFLLEYIDKNIGTDDRYKNE